MRARLPVGIIAAALAFLTVFAPSQFAPEQAAQALCYPPSTINPACQPQNIPILIDAGVISGGGATTTTGATVGGAAAGTGVTSLLVNGAAGTAGFLGLWLWLTGQDGGDGKAHGVAGINGVSGLKFDTDPLYVGGAPAGCITTPGKPGFLAPYNPGSGWPPPTSSGNYTPTAAASTMPRSCIMPADVTMFNSSGGNSQRMVVTLSAALNPTINTLVVSSGATYAKWALYYLCKVSGAVRYAQIAINSSGSNFQSTGAAGWFNPCGNAAGTEIVALQHFDNTGAQVTSILWNSATAATNLPLADNNIRGQIRTTITCRPTGGGADITVVVPGSVNVIPGETVPVPDALCPYGYINVETEIDFKKPEETTWAPLIESAPTPDEIIELPVLYPDCFPPSTKVCEMTLWKITPTGLEWCGQNGELCNGWAQQPGARENYECRYGDYTIEIDRCSAFRYPEIGKLPNWTPDGEPIPIEAPAPTDLPGQVVDPVTGTPVPIPSPLPGGGISTGQCFPTGWGVLNPVSWVVQPVQCALTWAFVPRQTVIESQVQSIQNSWNERIVGKVTTVLLPLTAVPIITGCNGVPVDIGIDWPVHWEVHWRFGDACSGPLAVLATVVRTVFGGGIVIGGLYALSSYFGGMVGFRGFGKTGDNE